MTGPLPPRYLNELGYLPNLIRPCLSQTAVLIHSASGIFSVIWSNDLLIFVLFYEVGLRSIQ